MKPKAYEMWDNTLNSVLKEQFFKNMKQCMGYMMGLVARTMYVYIYEVYTIYTYICGGKDFDLGRKTEDIILSLPNIWNSSFTFVNNSSAKI